MMLVSPINLFLTVPRASKCWVCQLDILLACAKHICSKILYSFGPSLSEQEKRAPDIHFLPSP